jgi:hypothetical protein
MAKAFSLASWNVEHFTNAPERVDRIVGFLAGQKPDVFGLYEVTGSEVFNMLVQRMPEYQFHITEGPQTQEILVGVRSGLTAFFTQKLEFNSGNTYLRPGALLSLQVAGKVYTLLFLHTKSSPEPIGLGIRDDQFSRAFRFYTKTLIKDLAQKSPNFMFLGDLNTMGMDYPMEHDIPAADERSKLSADAKKAKMRVLAKNHPATWWGGKPKPAPSDLDQVVAAEHMKFEGFAGADVDVRGWPKEPNDAAKVTWINSFSDHALLYLEVQK